MSGSDQRDSVRCDLSFGCAHITVSVHPDLRSFAHSIRTLWPDHVQGSPTPGSAIVRVLPPRSPNDAGDRGTSATGTDKATVVVEPNGSADAPALYALSGRITTRVINSHIGQKFLFHAAGAAVGPDKVIGLVAESGTGKSTAVRHLVERHGCGYVTDETLIIDPDSLAVTPYQKPVSQTVASGGKTDLPIETVAFDTPPQLDLLVLLARDASASGTRITPPGPGRGDDRPRP